MRNTIFLLFAIITEAFSQNGQLFCQIWTEDKPGEFANVWISTLLKGQATDSTGVVHFSELPPGDWEVEASYAGFFSQKKMVRILPGQITYVEFRLYSQALEPIVVTGTFQEIRRSQSPIPVEVVSSRLFLRNPSFSVFDALGMLSGVQPVLDCNVCNTGNIQINGIEGAYTQLLLDGMPIVSGLGTVYGLSGIPNSLIERIEVVKGPAGALYGSEAMAGQINIITKNPLTAPRFAVDVLATSWEEFSLDAGFRLPTGNTLSGLLSWNGFWFNQPFDKNDDGFTDAALQKRMSVFNKWHWKRPGDKFARLGARYVFEDRWGGQTNWEKTYKGSDLIYAEYINTRRFEGFGIYQFPIEVPFFIQVSFNTHDQDSYYGTTRYAARQDIGFAQLYLDKHWKNLRLLTGSTLRFTYYDDNTPATFIASRTLLPGVFSQLERQFQGHHTLLAGLRLDRHPQHGMVWSPRLAWHQHLSETQSLRFSVGNGFRVVSLFTEDHAALSGAREVVIAEHLRPEQSWSSNLNYHHNLSNERFSLNVDATAFYTHFFNRILPDYDADPRKIIYANLRGFAQTRGFTLQLDYADGQPIRFNTGVTFMDAYQKKENGEKVPQMRAPKWSGVFSANYTHPRSRISLDMTGNWYGPQRLPVVPLDFRPAYSPWFVLLNLQLSRKFKHNTEFYGGVKNLLNFIPKHPILRPFDPFNKSIDDPVNNPNGYFFDTAYNYAPLQGIRVFLGLRYSRNG